MKKKILIVTGSFGIGGSRSSLCSLLSVIDPNIVEVDVFSREHFGPLKDNMQNCRILPENVWLSYRIYNGSTACKLLCKVLYYIRGALQKVGFDMFRLYNYIGGKQIGSDQYDAVIGFDETLPRFVSSMPAKKRITWLHCDYRRHAGGANETPYYDKIDNIVCVSNIAKDSLLAVHPQYEAKVVIIRNAIDIDGIIAKSGIITKEVEHTFAIPKFTLISIGRLDPIKQFEKIPAIASEVKRMLKGRSNFQWLIIGGGNDKVKDEIEKEISFHHVENEVILLGMQSNPYPYLAKSDLYVCTSLSETFSYTIHEGVVLNVPFLCNSFPGALDSIDAVESGFIIPLDEMPKKIDYIMTNTLDLAHCTISNEALKQEFYNII